jgi:hypothetical protein
LKADGRKYVDQVTRNQNYKLGKTNEKNTEVHQEEVQMRDFMREKHNQEECVYFRGSNVGNRTKDEGKERRKK